MKIAAKAVKRGVAKVPVIMQLEALECGAACLDMILAYYGKWVPLEKVRDDCGVSRDGSKALNVVKAARAYGFEASGVRCEPEALVENGEFPCIVHWNFNHFVVLCGFKGNKVYLNDPARGSCTVSMDEFDECFTGVCLIMKPGENFRPGGKPESVVEYAGRRLFASKPAVLFAVLSAAVTSLFGLIDPVFTRIFADNLLTGKNPELFRPFIIVLSIFAFFTIAAKWIETTGSVRIEGKLSAVGNATYMWRVLHLPMKFFSQRLSGDILNRKESNGEIAISLVETIAPLCFSIIMMIFYLIVMMRYSVLLGCIGVSSVLINALVSKFVTEKRVNVIRVHLRDESKLVGSGLSGIEMIETIKAGGSENGFFEKWAGIQASLNEQDCRLVRIDAIYGTIPEFISELCDILVLGAGIYLTFRGNVSLGMIMAFQGFLQSFSSPALSLINAGQTLQEMHTGMERIDDVMNYPDDEVFRPEYEFSVTSGTGNGEPDYVPENECQKLSGNIELKDISFGYSPLEEPLLKHFNISIKQGSRVAIVGMSGCGKSTVSKIISGLYKPWSGRVLFDGKPLSDIDKSVFNASLAVVDQDIILFEDTIENNIKLWDSSIEDFEMILAARDAQIHEDIMMREGGYKYRMAEGGRDFSGGQRQRFEIARVLAQDPSIIILDEATSALDAKTEYQVVNAINARGITCIVIAHRLSTIRDCDNIIVLDGGKIAEQGTHDELMALNGLYVSLVSNN